MKVYYFEKLEVWQNAKKLSVALYRTTSEFPAEERFGITNQIRRASTGIAANIAEGTGRQTGKDQRRFLNSAYSSALEVLSFLLISEELGYISQHKLQEFRSQIELMTNQLNKLYKSIPVKD